MGKNSRAAAATTDNRSANKKTTNNQTVGANQPKNPKRGISKKLMQEAVENSQKSKNGIPENPRCSFGYKQLSELRSRINEAQKAERDNVASYDDSIENSDDGSDSFDDFFSAKSCIDPELQVKKFRSLELLRKLNQQEQLIMIGKFSNTCEHQVFKEKKAGFVKCGKRIPFAHYKIVPETNICVECGSHK